jgi:hypothetical protein
VKQSNQNPIQTRIGIIFIVLAIILFLINSKVNLFNLNLLCAVLFFGGIILATYGLTKIDVKEDRSYQKFIRATSKILLVFIFIFLILGIIGLIFQFPQSILVALLVLSGIFGVFYIINQWIFYIKTYKLIKKVNSKLNSRQKKNQLIFLIICVILGLGLWYLINYIIIK